MSNQAEGDTTLNVSPSDLLQLCDVLAASLADVPPLTPPAWLNGWTACVDTIRGLAADAPKQEAP